ncbi:hypothetical protein [Olsenella sp. kh2p3]|uniref:hypothetical protein n=1 Tax=Olsenella sp. kh2p3 TaxID=1797112 RepID=UPI000920B72E|nr:hypothetical protein [Olsenella sp. kh2p3]SFX36739.1 hypothetical protein SAMN04487823_10453 [Olsenella sp. kh2p3]
MDKVNHMLSDEERKLAASLVGTRIEYIEGYHLDLFDDYVLYHTARIGIDGRGSVDLSNGFVALRLPNGWTEDTGALALGPSAGGLWLPEGTAPAKLHVGETVRRIAIVDDEDVISKDGRPRATVSFTQAMVLELESGFLALDKGDWTDDYVHVRRGGDPDALLTDCSAPWLEDDGWSDAYRRRTTWL